MPPRPRHRRRSYISETRQAARRWLAFERLEDRCLLSGETLATAPELALTPAGTAHVGSFLSSPDEVDLYRVRLAAGDEVQANITAQTSGNGLQSVLRVFDAAGDSVALNDQEGGDPRLTFQAAAAADYYFGISSAGDDAYNPTQPNSGHGGTTTGLYSLDLRLTPHLTPKADLAGSSFRLGTGTAAWGEAMPVTFTLENRGGAAAGAFDVQVLLSQDQLFGSSSPVLKTFSVSGLASGQAFSPGAFQVTLPDAASAQAAGLSASGPVYLGLKIDPAGVVAELNPYDQSGVHRGEDFELLTIVTPAPSARGNNHSAATATPLSDPNSQVVGSLAAGQSDWYQLTVRPEERHGQLSIRLGASGGTPFASRLTLADQAGKVLIQSDSGSIVQYLEAGTYDLAVTALSGTGDYQLISQFVQAEQPLDPLPVGLYSYPSSVAVADVNGDGRFDLIVAKSTTVGVLLGNGDGTFQPWQKCNVGTDPQSVVAADVNGDGRPDLIVTNYNDHSVSVALGNGNGTFREQRSYEVGKYPRSVAVADVDGDGRPDLVVANGGDGTVSVLLGNGDGTFQSWQKCNVGMDPRSVAVADVDGDGRPDVIVANYHDNNVSVLLRNGDGTFQAQETYNVGKDPNSVAVADVNGDGRPDLIVANRNADGPGGGTVSVLLGKGEGKFQAQPPYEVGMEPLSVAVADVNGDGQPDIVAANSSDATVSVLLGNGDGKFQTQQTYAVGTYPESVAVGDVNRDGRPDIIVVNGHDGTVSVLPGNGDGTFQAQPTFAVGANPSSVAVVDIDRDGRPDLIVVNGPDGTVSVLLGNGDGTFQTQQTYRVGKGPASVAVADVNGDSRPDIIVTNGADNTVSVLLGNGDGTFQGQETFPAGKAPDSVAVADVDGDRRPDIIVASWYDKKVSVLRGNGDGKFLPPRLLRANVGPTSVADVNGDGRPDLIVANQGDKKVSVLLGNGDGDFTAVQPPITLGADPSTLAVAYVNEDDRPDLIVTNQGDETVSVLLGNGDGDFTAVQPPITVDTTPFSVAVADVNGDRRPDLIVAKYGDNTVSVLLGDGNGRFFQTQEPTFIGDYPVSVAAADVSGDGRPDLIVANNNAKTVSVLLGNGDSKFALATPVNSVGLRNTPHMADLNGDRIPDSVILDNSGKILYRQGTSVPSDPFQSPVTLNKDGPQARDLTVLNTGTSWAVAAANKSFDQTLSTAADPFVYTVSLYAMAANDVVQLPTAITSTLVPTSIAAGDLTGDGLDDLVVANALDDSVTIAFQVTQGRFSVPITLPVGTAPSDIALVDVDGDGRRDITVTDQASGDVSVLLNDASHSFARKYRFRAATGLYGLDTSSATPTISSLAQSVSLAVGDFTGNDRNDLVVVNRGSHSLTVLPNDGNGGFLDPQQALTTSTTDGMAINNQPGPIVAGDFNGDRRCDLAILMEDRGEVWIYTGSGNGTFKHTLSIPVGTLPSGLSLYTNPKTRMWDLLVGNQFGDILHLQGRGDGTFQPAGDRTTLSVQRLGNGQIYVLVANQQASHVTVQAPVTDTKQFAPVQTLETGSPEKQLAPGAVQWAKLEGDNSPFFDAIVVASGSNKILVYRGTGFDAAGCPTFATPQPYSVGTNPVSISIEDITGDGVPDMLIADKGSNDVTTLFGGYDPDDGHWKGTLGPRQAVGAGPIDAHARMLQGQTTASMIVTNAQSGTISVSPGVGQGLFAEAKTRVLNLPGNPVLAQAPEFYPNSNSGVVLTADGGLIQFNLDTFTANYVPAISDIVIVQSLPNRDLVVVERGGTVALLGLHSGSDSYDVLAYLTPLSGIPVTPSSLAVMQGEAGIEALVTDEGRDQIFVYASGPFEPPPSFEPGGSVDLPPLVVADVVVETATPEEASLILILSLSGGVLQEPTADPIMVYLAAGGEALPDAPSEEGQGLQESNYGLEIEEALRQLDLFQTGNEAQPDNASSGSTPQESSSLALFWQMLGEEQLSESALLRPSLEVGLDLLVQDPVIPTTLHRQAVEEREKWDTKPAPAEIAPNIDLDSPQVSFRWTGAWFGPIPLWLSNAALLAMLSIGALRVWRMAKRRIEKQLGIHDKDSNARTNGLRGCRCESAGLRPVPQGTVGPPLLLLRHLN